MPEQAPFVPGRNFYGRRHGKTLKQSHRAYLSEDLATLTPDGIGLAQNPARVAIDPAAVFGDARPLWLEVGFGGGEHLVHMAALYPGVGIIGCEPFVNGVATLLGKIRKAGVDNLAIYPGDVRDVFDVLPAGSVAKAFLNYPDPWPKRRHFDRRFVNPVYLNALAQVMVPGGEFRVATDIADYVRQTLIEVPRAGFIRADLPVDAPWADWISTRYEQKAIRAGRPPHYLTFHRAG